MERARRPRHQGHIAAPDAAGAARNPLCGDRVSLELSRHADGRIALVRHQSRACAICAAATDLMAELVVDRTAEESARLFRRFARSLRGGQPIGDDAALAPLACFQPLAAIPSRIPCALLGWEALLLALGVGEEEA